MDYNYVPSRHCQPGRNIGNGANVEGLYAPCRFANRTTTNR